MEYVKLFNKKHTKDLIDIWIKGFNEKDCLFYEKMIQERFDSDIYYMYGCLDEYLVSAIMFQKLSDDDLLLKWISTRFLYRNNKIATNLINYSICDIKNLNKYKKILLACNTIKLEEFYKRFNFVTTHATTKVFGRYQNHTEEIIRHMELTL